ncbi:threonine synthase [Acetonema longum]|uniref:Threonine synthase n=1 Tax=Acetonema longum DSM 6540 TaxID=1009370 RepID=F7NJ31_9FIRM|nr:threonine synthase [Acetonema longum]EGO63954.1 threonine synthase [Acetonema longum DSM 6540]
MYISTRGWAEASPAAVAIKMGMAPDGGLFVPVAVPAVDAAFLHSLTSLDYEQRAVKILALFLTDYSVPELQDCVHAAYGGTFDPAGVAPVRQVARGTFVLELWHGPTCAFKDMALQLLPQLLLQALEKTNEAADIAILVATSGDTGKAALEGFKDVDRTRIVVFYPEEGVSQIQRLQMVTQEGGNVAVAAVRGNFDDAQTGVKRIFNDQELSQRLAAIGVRLSSANSINWGRLVPQIVYYFSAYADLVRSGAIRTGQKVNFVVPTGNFGNILAGYYAKRMGLPVNRLICASNHNNVLTDFIRTGEYNRNRPFHKTISPSMDILISSNLERLLYHSTQGDVKRVSAWMNGLNQQGSYRVDEECLQTIRNTFWADWTDDPSAQSVIQQVWRDHNYVLDPHTAVAWQAAAGYQAATGDDTVNIIVSTASPFKFGDSVLAALAGNESLAGKDEFQLLQELSRLTGWAIPPALAGLARKPVKHQRVCEKADMPECVRHILSK